MRILLIGVVALLAGITSSLAEGPKPTVEASSQSANNPRLFVFPKVTGALQQYAYSDVCRSPEGVICRKKVAYYDFVGKTGFFVDIDNPLQRSITKIYELNVDGRRLYLWSLSKSEDPLESITADLIWKDVLDKRLSIVGKPIVPGSPVVVNSVDEELGAIRIDGFVEPFLQVEWKGVKALLRAQPPRVALRYPYIARTHRDPI